MGTLITIGIGIIIIYFGYLIRVKKMLSLIIGYDDNTFYGDKDKYAKRMGLTTIILGLIVITIPFIVLLFDEAVIQVFKIMIGVYVFIMIGIANYWRLRF